MRKCEHAATSARTPLQGEGSWAPHGLHVWGEGGGTRAEVRSCFSFPPKGIRRKKFGFRKIFLLRKVKKYLNTYLKDTEKFLSLEDRIDQC